MILKINEWTLNTWLNFEFFFIIKARNLPITNSFSIKNDESENRMTEHEEYVGEMRLTWGSTVNS